MHKNLRKYLNILGLGVFFLSPHLLASALNQECENSWGKHPLKTQMGNISQELFKNNFSSLREIATEYEHRLKNARSYEYNEYFLFDNQFATLIENNLHSCSRGGDRQRKGWLCEHIRKKGLYTKLDCEITLPTTPPFGGSEVRIIKDKDQTNKNALGAIKVFNSYQKGVKELACSLLASKLMVPLKCELNIAEVLLARRLDNQELYILLEGAPGIDINTVLSEHQNERFPSVLRAMSQYLATLHKKFKIIDNPPFDARSAYIGNHIQTLQNLVIEDQDCCKRFLKVFKAVKKDSNISWQGFQDYILNLCNQYENDNLNLEALTYTRTHGDAHLGNFYYVENQSKDFDKCYSTITMIDYETITNTYKSQGDPAEDVGRFLGGLWQWAVRKCPFKEDMVKTYEAIKFWEQGFLDIYLSNIKLEEPQENLIRKNSNFYKIEFYKAILGNKRETEDELKVKQRLFQFWMTQKIEDEKNAILTVTPFKLEE